LIRRAEDNAERVVAILVVVWLALVVAAVVVWGLPHVLGITIALAAVVAVADATGHAARAMVSWLQSQRARRVGADRTDSVVQSSDALDALDPVESAEQVTEGSPDGDKPAETESDEHNN
jgi:hypothetical protein